MRKPTFDDTGYLLHSNEDYEPYGLSMPSHLSASSGPVNLAQPSQPQVASLALAKLKRYEDW